ncbi:MAG: hypothetical protein JXA10_14945 [Anaerolineae bacterium]|nr:hypothetical protein [Anaerolineae bacterium]
MKSRSVLLLILMIALAGGGIFSAPRSAEAHQPYCEFTDLTFETAWRIDDPSVSLAFYANLYPGDDVDYYRFHAEAGQELYLQMVIPQIEGQDPGYVALMAISGPGLDGDGSDLPERVIVPADMGTLVVPMVDEATEFYEPFGRQYYWNWQDITFDAPETGMYTVAIWHPDEQIGRYTFVIGKREVIGGQVDCFMAMGDYFTPLVEGMSPYRDEVVEHDHDDEHDHD